MNSAGFCVAITKGSSAKNAICDTLTKDTGCELILDAETSMAFVSNPRKTSFVNHSQSGKWLVLAIGCSYDGTPVAEQVALQLSAKPSAPEDYAMEDLVTTFQGIYGQYCAIAFNTDSKQLVYVTDPSGIRSLFIKRNEQGIFIASGIALLRYASQTIPAAADEENQAFLFRYGYNLPSHTVFEDTKEIPPKIIRTDRALEKQSSTDFECASFPIKQSSNSISSPMGDDKNFSSPFEKELLSHLLDACRQQLGSARKVGVLLGGFDSALVASLLKHLGVEVETYSFHYEDSSFNQPFADDLAAKLSIKHHWVPISADTIKQGLEQYKTTTNWPVLWLNYVIQTQHLCSIMANNDIEQCFSGDGCDTVFLGYPSTHRRGQFYRKLPHLSTANVTRLKRLIHSSKSERILGHIGRVILSLVDAAQHEPGHRPVYSFQLFDERNLQRLTGMPAENYPSHEAHFEKFIRETENLDYERKVYLAKSLISPNRCKLVSSSDLSGMPIHSPYMHPQVANFAKTLPMEALRPSGGDGAREGKYLLMKMAENAELLPAEIIYQKKLAAVSSPIDRWLANELNQFALNKLENLPFSANQKYLRELLSEKTLEKYYKHNFASDGVVGVAASLLLTYACFFD